MPGGLSRGLIEDGDTELAIAHVLLYYDRYEFMSIARNIPLSERYTIFYRS